MPSQPPPPHPNAVNGDYYAASQMGGNAGGHGNHNSIFNGGEDDLKTQLKKIKAMYEAQNMNKGEYNISIGQVQGIQDELAELVEEANDLERKLEADLKKKFPRAVASKMAELDANNKWTIVGAWKSTKRAK